MYFVCNKLDRETQKKPLNGINKLLKAVWKQS